MTKKVKIAAIIGLLAIVAIIVFVVKKKKQQKEEESNNEDFRIIDGEVLPETSDKQDDKVDTGTYVIKHGDTLSQIALDNGTTVADLMAKNPTITNPDVIREGDVIWL